MMADAPQEKLWTPANIVTMIRICCVPVFVVIFLSPWPEFLPIHGGEAWKPWLSAIVFVLIAGTDAVDGYLARSRNEVTNFGKFMDPLADKILVCAALLALTELGVLPSWVTLIILTREFIVSGMRMIAASNGTVIAASWYGKAKTVTQMLAIVLFILKDGIHIESMRGALASPLFVLAWLVMAVALVLTILSMVDYLAKSKDLLGFGSSKKNSCSDSPSLLKMLDATIDSQNSEPTPEQLKLIEDKSLFATAQDVIGSARMQGFTLGCAESLTGGMITAFLTAIPGSSQVVRGSVVSYVDEIKRDVLSVDASTLKAKSAVSEETSMEMAIGARRLLDCDIAISVTGIAGPTGAEDNKPVGTVWVSIATDDGVSAKRVNLPGARDEVRRFTTRVALELIQEELNK